MDIIIFLASMEVLAEVEVEYITLPGWKTNIRDVRKYSDLPKNAQTYVQKIQELLGIPGTGVFLDIRILSILLPYSNSKSSVAY